MPEARKGVTGIPVCTTCLCASLRSYLYSMLDDNRGQGSCSSARRPCIALFVPEDLQTQAGKSKVESCLLHIKLCIPLRETKATSTQLFWKDLVCQAKGSNTKTDSQKIGRESSPARDKQTHFCPDAGSAPE